MPAAHHIHNFESQETCLLLHDEAMNKAKNYRRSEKELLQVLLKVEERKIYHQFEQTSLFAYCVDLLGLSKASAYDFIQVLRTGMQVPELLEAIYQDKTTVSKARKICSVITTDDAQEWIDLVIHCSSRVVEKTVAKKNPRNQVLESLKYVSGDVLELKLAVSEEWAKLLENLKDQLSQKTGQSISTEKALFTAMQEFQQRHDPVLKADRLIRRRGSLKTEAVPKKVAVSNQKIASKHTAAQTLNRPIPATIKHHVHHRDRGQCSYILPSGKRCSAKRWLDIHHIKAFKNGGDHRLENLETLCRSHHRMKHQSHCQLVT